MKTFATKEKRSAAVARKAHSYVHHPMGPLQQAQQTAMGKILRPGEMQAKSDIDENDGKLEQETDQAVTEFPISAISGIPSGGPGGAAHIQRSENEEPEEELQRQPEEEEEEPIQAKLLQRQSDDDEEEEPVQAKLIQRQVADMRRPQPSRFGYIGPEAKARQVEIRRILRSTGAQAKLSIGQPNDKYEQEADRVADQVMAMPDPKLQRQPENEEEEETAQTKAMPGQTPDIQRMCPECEEEQSLQRQPEEKVEELQAKSKPGTTRSVAPIFESRVNTLKGGGQPLPESTCSFFEPRFGADFSSVRVHTDSNANHLARSVNAKAFTVGHDVVFGSGQYSPDTSGGKKLLAHEMTHVLQQGTMGCCYQPNIVRASSEEEETPLEDVDSSKFMQVRTVERRTAAEHAQAIRAILEVPPEERCYVCAFRRLDDITPTFPAMPEDMNNLFATLELLRRWQLNTLLDNSQKMYSPSAYVNTSRVMAAMLAVKLSNTPSSKIADQEFRDFAFYVSNLQKIEQESVEGYIIVKRIGSSADSETLEGSIALLEAESQRLSIPEEVVPAAGQLKPGKWNPPGEQPIPYYIGTKAHAAIAAHYESRHPGQVVFSNYYPISTILKEFGQMGLKTNIKPLNSKQRDLKPDILNLTKPHLYEIKPRHAEAVAATEASQYVGLFRRAGVPIALGPTMEPGTKGVVPAPAGFYIFQSRMPGAIGYQYRKGKKVPVRFREPAKRKERVREKRFKFEIQPLTPQQQSVLAWLSAIGLVLLMLLLAPLGI